MPLGSLINKIISHALYTTKAGNVIQYLLETSPAHQVVQQELPGEHILSFFTNFPSSMATRPSSETLDFASPIDGSTTASGSSNSHHIINHSDVINASIR